MTRLETINGKRVFVEDEPERPAPPASAAAAEPADDIIAQWRDWTAKLDEQRGVSGDPRAPFAPAAMSPTSGLHA